MAGFRLRVKHLNPRQGITTLILVKGLTITSLSFCGVKHLNPRQGITTVAFSILK